MANTMPEEIKMKTGKEQVDRLPNYNCLWSNKDIIGFIVVAFGVGFFFGILCMAQ